MHAEVHRCIGDRFPGKLLHRYFGIVEVTVRRSAASIGFATLSGLLACLPALAQAPGTEKSVSIEIIAPDHRPDGKTWDLDIPVMLGPAMPNFGDPAPDMMLCVVDAESNEHCIFDAQVNRFGVPLSVCPNVYKCTFANVRVPRSGYFGVLVVDLDMMPSRHDYMLGAILHAGPADPAQNWKVEKLLKSLIARWHAVGAPDEFPEASVTACTVENPCFWEQQGRCAFAVDRCS